MVRSLTPMERTEAFTPNDLPAGFFTQESTIGVQSPLRSGTLAPTITIEHYEDALRFAARHTIEELVDLLATARPFIMADRERVSTRLTDAMDFVAQAHDVPRAVVRRQFDAAQIHFGVEKRKEMLGARRQKERRDSSGSLAPSSGDAAAAVPSSGKAVQDLKEMLLLREAELAASILVGLSNRAWWEGTGVKECEDSLGA
ncbi:hypothetical protein CERZMDRAFT_84031 [Cercospora zeae-maydis SCOH1-5]|uniref:Uncharacterized protein n=1 Tax=Cercospora zeae-maydis SCOH1-5 TaxID=717836 RepID=A0A6A6FI74_9PEZI|nr:hypothetical protein CERZMDRAFT_84031 [Cercospora zeae-maydis SCOH1-5]